MILLPGDILCVKRTDWMGGLIRRFSGPNWWTPGVVNHVAMMINPLEAVETGGVVRIARIDSYMNDSQVAIFRKRDLSDNYRIFLGMSASRYAYHKYGYGKIAAHLLDWTFGGIYLFRRWAGADKYPICSWIVARSYALIGIDFGVPYRQADPDDIWRWCVSRQSQYECIHPLKVLGENK